MRALANLSILATTAAAAAWLYFALSSRAPKIDLDPYAALGAGAAREAAALLADKGQVLVVARDTGRDVNPSVEAELRAFRRALKDHARLAVAIERVRVTPMLMMATGGGLPPADLIKAIETHKDARAVVLFFALPDLTEPEADTLKGSGVKVVVVSSLRPGYQRLLEQGAISLAIVPRADSPPEGAPRPRNLRERFDQQFAVLRSRQEINQAR